MFLIEGEFWTATNIKPKISSGLNGRNDLLRPDSMSEDERKYDLMRYLCGIICRNFGDHCVYVLKSDTIASSTLLFAAITKYLHTARHEMNCQPLTLFQNDNQQINIRRSNFLSTLDRIADGDSDVVSRTARRFNDYNSIISAYSQCATDLNARYLLSDLSLGGSNTSNDSFYISATEKEAMNQFSEKMLKKVIELEVGSASSAQILSCSSSEVCNQKRVTCFTSTERLAKLIGDDIPEFVEVSIADKFLSDNSFPWCELRTSCDGRQSNALMIVVLSGIALVEALAVAYDILNDPQVTEIELVRGAFSIIESQFPPSLADRIDLTTNGGGQVVIIFESLGSGSGHRGAMSKLLKNNASEMSSSSSCYSASIAISFTHERQCAISTKALQYISMNSKILVHMMTLFCIFDKKFQCISTNGDKELGDYICLLMQEQNRNALLFK